MPKKTKTTPRAEVVSRSPRAPKTPEMERKSRTTRRLGFEGLEREDASCSPTRRSESPRRDLNSTFSESETEVSVSYLELDDEESPAEQDPLQFVSAAYHQMPKHLKWLMFGLLALIIFSIAFGRPSQDRNVDSRQLKLLLRKHNVTDRLSQKAISLSLKRLQNRPLHSPHVVLFAHQGEKPSLLTDFSELATKVLDSPVADLDSAAFSTRIDLDSQVHGALSKKHILVLRNIEQLVADSPLVLHTVCDPESSLFPDSVVFLSVRLEKSFGNHSECEEAVSRTLLKRWSESLEKSKVSAVVSRATPLVVCT